MYLANTNHVRETEETTELRAACIGPNSYSLSDVDCWRDVVKTGRKVSKRDVGFFVMKASGRQQSKLRAAIASFAGLAARLSNGLRAVGGF